jgi:hypothetical protein
MSPRATRGDVRVDVEAAGYRCRVSTRDDDPYSTSRLRVGDVNFLASEAAARLYPYILVFLWAFGPEIEDLMDPRRYLVFYLLGGVAASLTQVAASPASTIPSLGASGAIAAVMGAFLVTYPRDRIRSLLAIFVFVRVTYIDRCRSLIQRFHHGLL